MPILTLSPPFENSEHDCTFIFKLVATPLHTNYCLLQTIYHEPLYEICPWHDSIHKSNQFPITISIHCDIQRFYGCSQPHPLKVEIYHRYVYFVLSSEKKIQQTKLIFRKDGPIKILINIIKLIHVSIVHGSFFPTINT